MARPTLAELDSLKAPADWQELGRYQACVISGKIDGEMPGEILTCGLLFEATGIIFADKSKRLWWRVRGKPSRDEVERWPTWDGIHDYDLVTRGHIEELKRGGWLRD